MEERNRKRGHKWIIAVLFFLALVAVGIFFFVNNYFQIKTVNVTGSDKYSHDQICEYVFKGRNRTNTLFFKHDYKKNTEITIPFIAKVDVQVKLPDTINITVYDKNIVGYVKYKGCNMYFDKDGIINESSTTVLDKIPYVEGLEYDSIVMHSQLGIDNPEVFAYISDITQYLEKYGMYVDSLVVNKDSTLNIRLGKVTVLLGECGKDIADKIYELSCMQEKLKDLEGILYLDKYTKESRKIIFKETKSEEIAEPEGENAADIPATE